jgi:Kef-type K+ transport system membrane component KefB
MPSRLPQELLYALLLFALFVLPRALQRYRLPSAITSFLLGAVLGLGFGLFDHDSTITLLSTLGIATLFLHAGLDVNLAELRRGAKILVQHILVRLALLVATTYALHRLLAVDWRAAALISLAVFTPSAGFILSSLDRLGLGEKERFWIRSKVISTELVALAVLFVTLRSESIAELSLSSLALLAMIFVLPFVFRFFARVVAPHAPRSEFGFLIIVAVLCAMLTRKLGVYYLVGAFLVGMAARRFQGKQADFASGPMLHAIEAFGSLFVPFYFFYAGLHLERSDFSFGAILAGLVLLLVAIPLHVGTVLAHRRIVLREPLREGLRIATPLLPTLVFTLVLVDILRENFQIPSFLPGALVLYTVVNTLIPGLFLRLPLPEYGDELTAASESEEPELVQAS